MYQLIKYTPKETIGFYNREPLIWVYEFLSDAQKDKNILERQFKKISSRFSIEIEPVYVKKSEKKLESEKYVWSYNI